MERIKMSVVVDDTTKEKAEQLSKETGYNQSQIIELLLKDATKEEILNLYKDVMMGVIK
jgi:antitoxin component of RelBE/YafQ-DinJ toxin-antitoxin module